jgi:hypothetical protein
MKMENFPQNNPAESKESKSKKLLKKVVAIAALGLASHAVDAKATNFEKKTEAGDENASKKTYTMSDEELRGMKKDSFAKIQEKYFYDFAIKAIKMELKADNPEIPEIAKGITKEIEKDREITKKAYKKILENKDTRTEYDLKNKKVIFHVNVDGTEYEFPFVTLDLVSDPSGNIEK